MHQTVWSPYQGEASGHWGPVTASIDWCEENYTWTPYIAEFFNTLSNVGFILLALHGATRVMQQSLPRRFLLTYIGVAGIGVGSFAFHATLKYEWQLLDEIPMIIVSSFLTWIVFDTSRLDPKAEKAPAAGLFSMSTNVASSLGLLATLVYDVLFTAAYLRYPNPVFHQTAYGIVQLVSVVRGSYLIYVQLPRIGSESGERKRNEAKRVLGAGVTSFLTGFVIWNLDNQFCGLITEWKAQLGAPWAWLLEGHSWWHLLTGYGAYLIVAGLELATLCARGDEKDFEMAYDLGVFAWVKRTDAGWAKVKTD